MKTRKTKSKPIDENVNPIIIKGSHLTITTYPNGKTELVWDDTTLLNDVRIAIKNYELNKKKT